MAQILKVFDDPELVLLTILAVVFAVLGLIAGLYLESDAIATSLIVLAGSAGGSVGAAVRQDKNGKSNDGPPI